MFGNEKRRHPRFFGSDLFARLKQQDVTIENISLGGALLDLPNPPRAGEAVMLELWFEGHALNLPGKVVRSEAHRARIRFNAASACSAAELYALVRSLPELPPPLPEKVLDLTDVVD